MMRLLDQYPEMSQRDLARELGISLGAAHYCLNALVEKGLVKFSNFARASHKQRYTYVLTPDGAAEKAMLTKRFLQRKWREYRELREELEALEAELQRSGEQPR